MKGIVAGIVAAPPKKKLGIREECLSSSIFNFNKKNVIVIKGRIQYFKIIVRDKFVLSKKKINFGVLLIFCMVFFGSGSVEAKELVMKKGINVNPWFTRPRLDKNGDYLWPPYPRYTEASFREDLVEIKKIGFDFIRIPVTSEPLLRVDSNERKNELINIGVVVKNALDEGLNVIFDLHPPTSGVGSYSNLTKDSKKFDLWVSLVEDASEVIAKIDENRIVIEPMNEPTSSCNDDYWPDFQKKMIRQLRKSFPTVKYTVTSSCYSSEASFKNLDFDYYVGDKNIYATFHYYSPFVFTHQGASWTGNYGLRILTGLAWPSRYGNLSETMDDVVKYAGNNFYYKTFGDETISLAKKEALKYYQSNVGEEDIVSSFKKIGNVLDQKEFPRSRIILGEFGVLKRERKWMGAKIDSASRWISTVRKAAENEGFSWAMWSYKEGMALTVSDATTEFDNNLIKALGL